MRNANLFISDMKSIGSDFAGYFLKAVKAYGFVVNAYSIGDSLEELDVAYLLNDAGTIVLVSEDILGK